MASAPQAPLGNTEKPSTTNHAAPHTTRTPRPPCNPLVIRGAPLNGLAEPSLDSDPGLPFSLRPSLSPQIGRCGDAKPRSFGCQSRILDPRPSSERGSPTSRSTPSPRTLRQCCYPCKAA